MHATLLCFLMRVLEIELGCSSCCGKHLIDTKLSSNPETFRHFFVPNQIALENLAKTKKQTYIKILFPVPYILSIEYGSQP